LLFAILNSSPNRKRIGLGVLFFRNWENYHNARWVLPGDRVMG